MLTGLIDDLERIFDEMFGEISGWELAAGVLVLFIAWPVSILVGWVVKKLLLLVPGVNVGLASFAKWVAQGVIWLVVIAWSMTVLNIGPGFVLVITISLVAIAVALAQPIARNVAAGLILPFWEGDQIETHAYVGTVVAIQLRQTTIETRDQRKVHIPNSDVLANPIVVFTAFEQRRSSVDVGISYGTDIGKVAELLVDAVSQVDGVDDDPRPYALASGFADGMYRLTLRWWHASDLATAEETKGAVLVTVKLTLDAAGIPIPPPASVFLTEAPQIEPTT